MNVFLLFSCFFTKGCARGIQNLKPETLGFFMKEYVKNEPLSHQPLILQTQITHLLYYTLDRGRSPGVGVQFSICIPKPGLGAEGSQFDTQFSPSENKYVIRDIDLHLLIDSVPERALGQRYGMG